jgi:hypothetical protein
MAEDKDAKNEELSRDWEAAYSGPATLANRFLVTLHPSGARIAFMERRSPEALPAFRAAVILSYQDAVELSQVLNRMLQPVQDALSKENAPETSNG